MSTFNPITLSSYGRAGQVSLPSQLTKAMSLIAEESRWISCANASDANGDPRHALDTDAVRWSSVGALVKVDADMQCAAFLALCIRDHRDCRYRDEQLIALNAYDTTHSHVEVMHLWKCAIALAEQHALLSTDWAQAVQQSKVFA